MNKVYVEAFNKALDKGYSTSKADLIATVVESNHNPIISTIIIPTDNKIVFNTTSDEITFEGVLADTSEFIQSLLPFSVAKFSVEALKDIADQINKFGSTAPDIDHEVGRKLDKIYGKFNTNMIMNAYPQHKGMLKNVHAIYDNGKLWIRGTLDNKYRSILPSVKGLSIESVIEDFTDTTITKSKYLGFTLAVNHNPKISSAKIISYD